MPNTSLKVCEPRPNSGVLVLPIDDAAGRLHPLDHQRVDRRARSSASSGEPKVVADALVAVEVLDRLRHAVHPAHEIDRVRAPRRTSPASAQQLVAVRQADDRVDRGLRSSMRSR